MNLWAICGSDGQANHAAQHAFALIPIDFLGGVGATQEIKMEKLVAHASG